MERTISEIFADYIASTNFDSLPQDVIEATKMSVLDSIGCILGGYRTEIGGIVVKTIESFGSGQEATILGRGMKTNAPFAGFANSTMANILDFDDFYMPVGHPGATIVPPALAVGEKIGESGKAFLTSVLLGNEVSIRIGDAIRPSIQRQKTVWGVGTFQTFGAAVSAGKLLGLSRDQLVHAQGIAGTQAPVPSVCKTVLGPLGSTMVKNNYGAASEMGILSAILAQHGFEGPKDIFDGPSGFWIMAGSDRCDFDVMTSRLGTDYKIRKLEYKPYPCCRWTHSPIDATLQTVRKNNLNVDEIEHIVVNSYYFCTKATLSNPRPKRLEEAVFSTRFGIASALLGIPVGSAWYTKERFSDPRVLDMIDRIELIEDEEANEVYPEKFLAKVTIHSKSDEYHGRVEYPKGGAQNPMGREELVDKFRQIITDYMPAEKRDRLVDMILHLEELNDVRSLTSLLVLDAGNGK